MDRRGLRLTPIAPLAEGDIHTITARAPSAPAVGRIGRAARL